MTETHDSEWRVGWRIVLGCAMASATGVALLFFTFSLFLLPLAEELNVSRGQLGIVQALIITAALGSPVIGRMTDIYGFRPVYFTCTLIVATIQVTTALLGSTIWHMAISIALTGFFSVGSTAVAITRPIRLATLAAGLRCRSDRARGPHHLSTPHRSGGHRACPRNPRPQP